MTREHLRGAVHGTNYQITRDVTGIPTGQTVTKAWLTMKKNLTDSDNDARMQKVIDENDVVGTGQVTNPSDGAATVRFDIHGSDWNLVIPGNILEYDIQIKTSSGYIYPVLAGTFVATARVTQAIA